MVDSDEFHEYGASVSDFLLRADGEGFNWIKGTFADRVSATGALTRVSAEPSIFEQYPLRCDVAKSLQHAETGKVAAFKVGLLEPLTSTRPGTEFAADAP
jgi:hypothetical protein